MPRLPTLFKKSLGAVSHALLACPLTCLLPLVPLQSPSAAPVPPPWSVGAPIYEVNLQMFSAPGTYRELEKQLPRLHDLGVRILWLMPITTRGELKAFGSPYCVRDYKGFHAPYGSPQDFRALVAAVHAQGMRLILDWVPNHSAWDNNLTKEHPEFYKKNPDGSIAQAYGWSDVAQLDYGNAGLRAWMIEAMKYWVKEYDVDGFRVDVAWGVPVDFFQAARAALDSVKPVFLLAENNNPAYQVAFDSDYDWNLLPVQAQTPLTDIANGAKPATALDAFLQKDIKDYAPSFMRMRFTSNHDEWKDFGTPFQRLKGGVKTLATLTATLPGKPLLYNGQEIGWNPSDKAAPIAWKDSAAGYASFYRALLRAHGEIPALHAGDFTKLKTDQDARIYAYNRKQGDSRALVMLNLSSQTTAFTIDLQGLDADWKDLFTGSSSKWYASMTFSFAPWEYRVQVAGPQVTSARSAGPALRAAPALPRLLLDAQGRLTVHPVGARSPLDALGRHLLPAGQASRR